MAKESEAIAFCGVLRVCFVFRSQPEKWWKSFGILYNYSYTIYDFVSCNIASVMISDGYLKEKITGQHFRKTVELSSMCNNLCILCNVSLFS